MKKIERAIPLWIATLAALTPLVLFAQDVEVGSETDQEPYLVGQAVPPVDTGSDLVAMTLSEAVQRALESNLDIQTARLNPLIQNYAMRSLRAAFDPTLQATYGFTNSTNQSTSQLDGGARTTTERQQYNLSLNQTLPWYGGELSANFNNTRTETNNAFFTRNPSYNSQLSLNFQQPLLSGFKTDQQRNAVRTQEIQNEITNIQVSAQVANITEQVRRAYWALRSSIEEIEIQRRNLAQAERLLADNRISVELGRMAELQLAQSEAQVASAEQALLNAEIQWRSQELAFKRLLLGGADDPLLLQTVNPVELPVLEEQAPDIQAAIDVALRERTDIRQQRHQRRVSELDLEVTKEGARPTVNLTAAYSLQGVGGNLFDRTGLGGEPELIEEGGYFDGLESIADFDTPTWSITVNASYPVGLNRGEADVERAELAIRQADLALRSQELAIVTEVTNAGLAVRNTFLQVEAARRSREAAERSAEAEQTRFRVGVSTNFEVVSAQDDLTQARLSELRAIIHHVNAVAEFERVQRIGGAGGAP